MILGKLNIAPPKYKSGQTVMIKIPSHIYLAGETSLHGVSESFYYISDDGIASGHIIAVSSQVILIWKDQGYDISRWQHHYIIQIESPSSYQGFYLVEVPERWLLI